MVALGSQAHPELLFLTQGWLSTVSTKNKLITGIFEFFHILSMFSFLGALTVDEFLHYRLVLLAFENINSGQPFLQPTLYSAEVSIDNRYLLLQRYLNEICKLILRLQLQKCASFALKINIHTHTPDKYFKINDIRLTHKMYHCNKCS